MHIVPSFWVIVTTQLAQTNHMTKPIINGMRKYTLCLGGSMNGKGLGGVIIIQRQSVEWETAIQIDFNFGE